MSKGPNLPPEPRRKASARLGILIALPIIAAGAVAAYLYGGLALDAVRAAQFTPSTQLAAINNRIALTGRAQQIFYATAPQIQDKTQFRASCNSIEGSAAILGCYYLDRIYLYNIQNKELDGTMEVTAAHELLHAAYARLNVFERQEVDAMVEREYQKVKDQPEISQLMQYYKQHEPGAEADELHSILGTTIAKLSPELEQYYARYFADRSVIVALNAKYKGVFSELSRRADELQKQIDAESMALKDISAAYQTDLQQLNIDIETFNARANGGGFSTQSEFTVALNALQLRIHSMNTRQQALNNRINAYNAKVEQLNSIAVHVTKLNESLSGVSAPSGVQ